MGEIILNILGYLWNVIFSTFMQLLVLLGPLLFLAFLMNFSASKNENLSYRVFGQKVYLYVFAWLGTAIHELGHALFALLFRHKITEMELFSPNSKEGSLGHVNHSYDPNSIYQNIGNFFIGIGPVISGSLFLYIISFLLFGFSLSNTQQVDFHSISLTNLDGILNLFSGIYENVINYLKYIFIGEESSWWKIILLFYLLYSVGSSITLSGSDIKSGIKGFIYFLVVLFFFNLATLWMGDIVYRLFQGTSRLFTGLYILMIISFLINIFFVIILYFVSRILKK